MIGNKCFSLLLIAGVLLTGVVHAEVAPGTGAAPVPGKSSSLNGTAILTAAQQSLPSDEAAAKKAALSAPETGTVQNPAHPDATAADSVAAPGDEAVSGPEAAPGEDSSAEETVDEEEPVEEATIADPIEPWNRAMYHFNDKLYFWVLKPVAKGYNAVVPEPARISIRNMFTNAAMPIRFVNCLLQFKLKGAGVELLRFGLNSVIGLAGLFDVAKSRFELDAWKEDFGQTLGYYGMGGLMYIVWPFLGPSTVRDTIGFAGDSFLYPVNYINPFEAAFGVQAYERINNTSLELGTYEDMKNSSLEPYTAIRDAFVQYRKEQIRK